MLSAVQVRSNAHKNGAVGAGSDVRVGSKGVVMQVDFAFRQTPSHMNSASLSVTVTVYSADTVHGAPLGQHSCMWRNQSRRRRVTSGWQHSGVFAVSPPPHLELDRVDFALGQCQIIGQILPLSTVNPHLQLVGSNLPTGGRGVENGRGYLAGKLKPAGLAAKAAAQPARAPRPTHGGSWIQGDSGPRARVCWRGPLGLSWLWARARLPVAELLDSAVRIARKHHVTSGGNQAVGVAPLDEQRSGQRVLWVFDSADGHGA